MLVNPLFYNQEFIPAGFYTPQFVEYSKPKLVKKLENDELVQFKIFKLDGNFNNFEFKLIKLNDYQGLLEVFSLYDDFKVSVKLNLTKIDIQNINFEVDDYNRSILNLNIPKKVPVYQPQDLFNEYLNNFFNQINGTGRFAEEEKLREEQEKVRKQEEKARREQERARREQEKARKEQERIRKEKERQERIRREQQERQERIRKEQERQERIRKEQEKLRKEQERQQKIQREKEARLRKVKEEKLRKQQEEQQKQAQEFMNQLFSGFFGLQSGSNDAQFAPFQFPFGQPAFPEKKSEPEHKKARSEPKAKPAPAVPDPEISAPAAEVIAKSPVLEPEVETPASSAPSTPTVSFHDDEDETASIDSNMSVDTPDSLESLHKHPSIEEVEDEEFVMLRKKFGQ